MQEFRRIIAYHPDRLMRQPRDLEELLQVAEERRSRHTPTCTHPVRMRRPALSQAPEFRLPGGAAAHPETADSRTDSPPRSSRQPTLSPPGAARRPADSAHPAPEHGHEPSARTPVTSSHVANHTCPEARRKSKRVDISKRTSRARALAFRPARRCEHTAQPLNEDQAQRHAVNLEGQATRATAPAVRTNMARVAGNDYCSGQGTRDLERTCKTGDQPPSEHEPKAATAGLRDEDRRGAARKAGGTEETADPLRAAQRSGPG